MKNLSKEIVDNKPIEKLKDEFSHNTIYSLCNDIWEPVWYIMKLEINDNLIWSMKAKLR